jgi:hypothetical protein
MRALLAHPLDHNSITISKANNQCFHWFSLFLWLRCGEWDFVQRAGVCEFARARQMKQSPLRLFSTSLTTHKTSSANSFKLICPQKSYWRASKSFTLIHWRGTGGRIPCLLIIYIFQQSLFIRTAIIYATSLVRLGLWANPAPLLSITIFTWFFIENIILIAKSYKTPDERNFVISLLN